MLGWLTALLFTLIAISTIKVREGVDRTLAADPSGEAVSNAISTDYQKLLDAYASAVRAQVSGTSSSDSVAQVKNAISDYQDSMRTQIQKNQYYIQTFLDDYKDMNPELDALHKQAQVFKTQGPQVGDELVKSATPLQQPVDYTALLTRVGVLTLILGATFAISAFSPPQQAA